MKKLLEKLKNKQRNIRYESSEDEGAAEYYAELQSVIDVIENGGDEQAVRKACEWVGVAYE